MSTNVALTRLAVLRMFTLAGAPEPGTVAEADLRTSMADARCALQIASGVDPDCLDSLGCVPEQAVAA